MNAYARMARIFSVLVLAVSGAVACSGQTQEVSYPDTPVMNSAESYPSCEEEDGSTQDVCTWAFTTPSGAERVLVNHNYGEWTFYPHTGAYITWDSEPTPEEITAATR